MLREWRIDLHIHTCLSPCGDSCMVPTRIVDIALERGLDVVAITDHNTAENVEAVRLAADRRLTVLGGMEITTAEEVHLLVIFEKKETLEEMQDLVQCGLEGENDPEAFGDQWIVDESDGIVGKSSRLLMGATSLSVEEVVEATHRLEGMVIASHVDKQVFSIVSQLGFIPDGLELDALEISPHHRERPSPFSDSGYALASFSDAHFLEEIGRAYSRLLAIEPSVDEIRDAVHGLDGRGIFL